MRVRRRLSAALFLAAIAAAPAAAQQAPPAWPLARPPDSGKPIIYDPQFIASGNSDRLSGCSPGLQCRFRLLGVIQNNGAVELRVSAFRW